VLSFPWASGVHLMALERWRRVESLFHGALGKSARERSHLLDQACSTDESLRREVESLLANEELAAEFLESENDSAATATLPAPLPAGQQIGPYSITQLLGAGGMGQVYGARDERLDRCVAMKFLPPHLESDAAARNRFEREARAASALNHPNLCTVYDIGEFQGRPYLVMELLEGESLKARLSRGPVSLSDFFDISRQICAGLSAAHAKQIVHRDIKPANIFLTEGGQVKIVDFGLAKRGPESIRKLAVSVGETRSFFLTSSGTILGTLAYMAPEQALGREVDARTDVFSLGVVLYEMVTGQTPFQGKTPAGLLDSILTESPARPATVNPAAPAGLDRIILKAIEKDPAIRYQSVAALLRDLEQYESRGRTRRWLLASAGVGAAAIAAGTFVARRVAYQPERRIRIAVLPFENTGGNPKEAFFADGLHQDMISVLNRLYHQQMAVIARTSVRRYRPGEATVRQIGRELNVAYVVEGAVQRAGGRAHITARLIRANDETPVWTSDYDRDLSQSLAVQSEIAQAVAQGIGSGLRPDWRVSDALSRPLNPAAHEAYLRGEFQKAVEIDPGYAAAWTGIAKSSYYPALFGFQPPHQTFARMTDAATKALQLDATQASAHAYLALGKLHLHWGWADAEQGFRTALRLNPNDPDSRHFHAHLLLWSGRVKASVEECEYALNVDPFDAGLIACLGFHSFLAGEERALKETLRSLAIQPDHFWSLMTIGWIYEGKGMYQEALSAFRDVGFNSGLKNSSIAHAFALSGDRRMAEKVLGEMLAESRSRYVSPCDLAVIYAGLGHFDAAFDCLSRAWEERAGWLMFTNSDPRFKPLRSDPRFRNLLARMKHPLARA
jgi:eukaryotic-like serine/threonine-protein kinase